MFGLVEKYKRVIQVFLGLLALTFMTWGIESYTRFVGGRDTIATVNGIEISQREFSEQFRQQQEQVRRMFGAQVDPAALDTPEARRALLDSLIGQRLLASEAARSHMLMSREAVIEAITQAPEFQEDGKFSAAKYSAYLQSRGVTDQGNVAELQSRLPLNRLVQGIADTAIPSRTVAARLNAIESQKREVQDARISAQQFEAQVKIDDAKIKAHYDANSADYRTPERVRAEYVVLSAEALSKDEAVPEEELRKAYEARASRYSTAEQRRAAHILVKTKDEADKLVKELAAAPNRFAELAKQHSQDPVSAANGGDLGIVTKDSLVSDKLATAVMAMKQGETRAIESEFGVHVVRITALQPGKSRPFEEVRKELAAEVAKERGARRYAEAAETFGNLVYEQADSLKPAADKFKLQVQKTEWIAKGGSQELGALDNPKLLAALFSADSLKNKRNTDAIEVAPATLVAARVIEHQPAAQRKLEEVKDEIAKLLRQREASELALKDGLARLEKLKKGEDAGVKWGQVRTVSRRDAQGMPIDVLRRVVSADVSKLPAYVGVPIPDAGYLILRISKVIEGDAKEDPQSQARIDGLFGGSQFESYVAALRARGDVKVNAATLEKK